MEERQQENRATAQLAQLRGPAHPGDAGRTPGQQLGGEIAQRADDPRLDQADLLEQVGVARLDLDRRGVAIPGRPAHQDVGDEDFRTRHPDLLQQLGQESARAADERQPLAVLFRPRRLADEHHVGIGVAGAEDDLVACRGKGAALADDGLVVDLDEALAPLVAGRAHERRFLASASRSRRPASRSRRRASLSRTLAPRGR